MRHLGGVDLFDLDNTDPVAYGRRVDDPPLVTTELDFCAFLGSDRTGEGFTKEFDGAVCVAPLQSHLAGVCFAMRPRRSSGGCSEIETSPRLLTISRRGGS